jgi:hypothetical protein
MIMPVTSGNSVERYRITMLLIGKSVIIMGISNPGEREALNY